MWTTCRPFFFFQQPATRQNESQRWLSTRGTIRLKTHSTPATWLCYKTLITPRNRWVYEKIPQICNTTTETTIYARWLASYFLKLREVVVAFSVLCYVHYVAKSLSPNTPPHFDNHMCGTTVCTRDTEKIYMCTHNSTTTGNSLFFFFFLKHGTEEHTSLGMETAGRRAAYVTPPFPSLGISP